MLAVALCEGCRSTYKMTLFNGEVITARGKPQYDSSRSSLIYTDGNGNKQIIGAGDVREVKPSSWKSSEDDKTTHFIN